MSSKLWVLGGLAFELTGLIVAFVLCGSYLDRLYKQPGFFTAGGAFIAFAIWVVHLVFVLKKLEESEEESSSKSKEDNSEIT